MKRGTPRHPKVCALASKLGVPRWGAVGLLEMLWHFSAEFAHAGDVGRFQDAEIAFALGWEKEPQTLISALVETGWLDACKCHRLRVHDWPSHADQTVQRVLAKRNQRFLKCYDHASIMLASCYDETSQPSPSPSPISLSLLGGEIVDARPPEAKTSPEQVRALHNLWQDLTGRRQSCDMLAERQWFDWTRYGYTAADLSAVIRLIRAGIANSKRNDGALKLSNLLNPERFAEDLAIARQQKPTSQKPKPQPQAPKPQPAEISEEAKKAFQAGLEAIKGRLRYGDTLGAEKTLESNPGATAGHL